MVQRITSLEDLRNLTEIPKETEFIEWRGNTPVRWTNNISPELTKGFDYSPWYLLSDKGDSYSIAHHTVMKNHENGRGYYAINFYKSFLNDGKVLRVLLNRAVLRTFTPSESLPSNWKLLDAAHLDDNPANNTFENLQFMTHQQNCNAPHFRESISGADHNRIWTAEARKNLSVAHRGIGTKAIIQLNPEGVKIAEFPSVIEAAQKNGVDPGNISAVCNGRRKTAGGYRWQFA